MILLSTGFVGVMKSIGEFLALLIAFLFVVALAYVTSKLAGKYQQKAMRNSNVEIIETQRIANNKLIQIIKVGNKVIAVGIGKDEVTFLSEVDPESIKHKEIAEEDTLVMHQNNKESFQDILKNLSRKNDK